MITLSPVGAIKLITKSPMKLCSMSMQMDCRLFAFVKVCPGANCVKVTVLVKHSPTLSGRKTPPPAFGFGSSFHVVPCTTPFKQRVSPTQPVSVPPVPTNVGSVPTRVIRSTRLVLAQPLLSMR